MLLSLVPKSSENELSQVYEGHVKSMVIPQMALLLTSCFAHLWTWFSVTQVFNFRPANIDKTSRDEGLGTYQGVSDVKLSISLVFYASKYKEFKESS